MSLFKMDENENVIEKVVNKTTSFKRKLGYLLIIVLVISGLFTCGSIFENVPAGSICVIQSPISGELVVHFEPGLKLQKFGKVTTYPRSSIYEFLTPVDPDDPSDMANYRSKDDKSIKIQFNDSGSGWVSGSIRYDYPLEIDKMKHLHRMFQNHDNVINGLIKPNVERVINMTGPLMSSIESSRTRRAEIPQLVEDQLQNGLYQTVTKDIKTKDEITGQDTTIKIAEFIYNQDGSKKRQSVSIITQFGLNVYNLNINKVSYESKVLQRLDALFTADSEKQLAYMRAIKAEQDNKTAAQEGEAKATLSEWEAKAITSRDVENANRVRQVAVIEAEQRVKVAEQDKIASELESQKILNISSANAKARTMLMQADGALQQKLDAYIKVNEKYALAIQTYTGDWVPKIIMGNAASIDTNGATTLIQMLNAKTALDLSLDMDMKKIK